MKLRWAAVAIALVVVACGDSPPGRTYFERNIQPILEQKCAGNTSGCHSTNDGDPFAIAAGNLDVTSFENIQKRRDVLAQHGAYPYPLLLIKAVGPNRLKMPYQGRFLDIDVQHSGGGILDPGSDAYFALQTWLDNGATENGLRPASPPRSGTGDCSTFIPAGFDASRFVTAATQAAFERFKSSVQPRLETHGCTAGSCHGAPHSDFYITCGNSEDELAFNFSQAWAFVTDPVGDSQLLRVPLAAGAGGRGHTGGDQFDSVDDEDYRAFADFAAEVGVLPFGEGDPNRQFFAANVQPMLLARGCAFAGCHSPQAANDFKLRPGSVGFMSAISLEKNYNLLRHEFMALEMADARRSRAVAKSILDDDPRTAEVGGIVHRGGPVLETPGTGPAGATCPPFDPATSTAFCTMQAWLDRERAALGSEITPMAPGDPVRIVYVERPTGQTAGRLEFDTFQGNAELKVLSTTFGTNGRVESADAGAATTISTLCTGITTAADVQTPDVANDGNRVVFAARNSAAEPLGVFLVDLAANSCVRVTPAAADSNGLKVHDFDPAFSPDGEWIVFASTRGKPGDGARKSRKRFLPQSDLWRIRVNGTSVDAGSVEQMTFLSNSEISPQFMREGRVIMTTEKASTGFYQLSGRRMNWDLTDYHPLLAQRKDSPYADPADLTATRPSVGFSAATDIRENANGDFLVILSDTRDDGSPAVPGAAGALAIFNRSIGPFEAGRTDIGFLEALRILDGGSATGREGATTGYRHPYGLPDGTIMVSHASNAAQSNFEVVAVSPRDGSRRLLITGGAGRAKVDAVLALKYPRRELYLNRRQLVFGGDADSSNPDDAIVHMPDAISLFTLLTGNLRRGRPVAEFDEATTLVIHTEGMCGTSCTPNAGGIFEQRARLGQTVLATDGSAFVRLPSRTGVVFELVRADGSSVVKMTEEHQLGPGEFVSMGVPRNLVDPVCGGCHGSISGRELDTAVTPDALTGASQSIAREAGVVSPSN